MRGAPRATQCDVRVYPQGGRRARWIPHSGLHKATGAQRCRCENRHRQVISANITECLTCFASGRNFLDNLLELDTELRILTARAGEAPGVESIPILLSLDIKAAFPSVSQQWLAESLAATEPPEEIANFVTATWRRCTPRRTAWSASSARTEALRKVARGVGGSSR